MAKLEPRKIMVSDSSEPSTDEVKSAEKKEIRPTREKVIQPISSNSSDKQNPAIVEPEPGELTSTVDSLPGEIKFTEEPDSSAIEPPVDELAKLDLADQSLDSLSDNTQEAIKGEEVTAGDDTATAVDVPGADLDDESDEADEEPEADFEPAWRKHQAVPRRKGSKKRIVKWALVILLVGLIAACIYPDSRYWLLRQSTLKKSFEITFADQKTGEPISNLQASIGDSQQVTDENGRAQFDNIRLGQYSLSASRPGFAPVNTTIALELWTHYSLPKQTLQVIGVRFHLQTVDWLSGKPVMNAEAKYDSSVAKATSEGKLTVITPPLQNGKAKAVVSAEGYHSQTVTLQADKTDIQPIKLVPAPLSYFMSNRDGKYGVYSSWLDGTHQTQVLGGTGNEKSNNTQFIVSPNNEYAALITTRNNIQNPKYTSETLNELFVLNLQNSKLTKIANGPIKDVGWIDNSFIYQATNAQKSYEAKDATRLMSVKADNSKQITLATSNNFAADSKIVNGQIYYSPNDSYNSSKQAFFSKINPDAADQQKLIDDKIIMQIARLSYNQLQLQAQDGKVLNFDTTNNKVSSSTNSNTDNIYTTSPDGGKYVWVEQRDGKATLFMQAGSKKPEAIYKAVGISNPIHWLGSNIIVFQVSNDSGVSNYALSLDGGSPRKISDVSSIGIN